MQNKQKDIFDLVGYALPEGEREKFPERMKALSDYREMSVAEILNDSTIEGVILETEEIYLTKYACLAAEHHKHIHMEKPGGICLAEFERLISVLKKNQRVFHMGYMYRYNPFVEELFRKIQEGELGDIISIEAQMSGTHSPELRQWLSTFPGGELFFLGCHLIDLILQIQGKPKRVIPLNKSTGFDNVSSEDFGMVVLEYQHGFSFAKVSGVESGGFHRRQFVVTGTKGTVELKPLEIVAEDGQQTLMTHYRNPDDWFDSGISSASSVYDRYDTMMASFAAMVRGEKTNPRSYDDELELYQTILACCKREET